MNRYRMIDTHCHIYPDTIARKAVSAVEHFYDDLTKNPHDGTASTLVKSGEAAGISHFVVHSVATTPRQVSAINRFISQSVQESGGRFTGMGTMHLESESFERDLDELQSLGLVGVKLHPDIQEFCVDDPRAMKIFELCEDRGLPVCVHTGDYRYDYSNPPRVRNVLEAFPKLTFIGAHFGGWSVWKEAARVLPDYPNIIVDTSSTFYLHKEHPQWIKELIRVWGAERVMFGTDYPLWDQNNEIDYLLKLDLTEEEYQQIFWKTAADLFDIQ